MTPDSSRFAVGIFIVLVSLSGAYATLNNFSDRPAGSTERLYEELNVGFASHWRARTGLDIKVDQALSSSGKPVHITLDGLEVPALRCPTMWTSCMTRKDLLRPTSASF